MLASKSLASLLLRPIQAKNRSTTHRRGGRQIRLDHAPFLIGHIALVAQTVASYSSCGWLGSTWHLRIGVSNRSE